MCLSRQKRAGWIDNHPVNSPGNPGNPWEAIRSLQEMLKERRGSKNE